MARIPELLCLLAIVSLAAQAEAQGSYGFPQQPSGSAPPPPYDYRQQQSGGQYFPYETQQSQQQQQQQQQQQRRGPPAPPHLAQFAQFPGQQKPYEQQKQGESIWQRLGQKLFQGDGQQQQQQRRPPQYTGVPQNLAQQQRPVPSQQHRMQGAQQQRIPLPWQQSGSDDGSLIAKGLKWLGLGDEQPAQQGPGPFGGLFSQQYPQAQAGYPGYQQQQQQPMGYQPQPTAQSPYPPLPPLGAPSQGYQPQQQQQQQPPAYGYDSYGQVGGFQTQQMPQPTGFGAQDMFYQQQQQPPPAPYIPEGPGTPEMYVVDDNVVFILRPNDFYRKKQEFVRSGPHSVQVMANFEKTFTKFKSANGQPAITTESLLENSGYLPPHAAAKIRQLRDEYAQQGYMDDASYEELASKIRQVIALEGGLHFEGIAPMVREHLMNIPLREGWNEVISKLAWGNIPLYLFSSGYGDVAAQVMAQNDPNALMHNVRVISNSFRLAPDGVVRGFTQPIVHERNKNATTAARVMELPLTQRPNVLVLGTEEQDLAMSSGTAVNEQISVAYLELTDDLTTKLPRYLETFDVVILGDGSMTFISQLINELVGGPQ